MLQISFGFRVWNFKTCCTKTWLAIQTCLWFLWKTSSCFYQRHSKWYAAFFSYRWPIIADERYKAIICQRFDYIHERNSYRQSIEFWEVKRLQEAKYMFGVQICSKKKTKKTQEKETAPDKDAQQNSRLTNTQHVAKVSVEVASLSIRLSCLEDMNMVVSRKKINFLM